MNSTNPLQSIKKLNYRDLIIFLIPFTIFMLYLYIYNPGIMNYDSFNQIHQIATNNFTNWHPFFHTFIEMLCLKIYPNVISIAILQIFVFSSLWMIICKYHRNDTMNNNSFILQVIITCIISLIPINAIYSITLWKDILFSYFLMFLCFLIKVMLDKQGKVDLKFILIMAVVMAFISQLRMNGFYVTIIVLIILTIYFFRKSHSKKICIALPSLTIIFILLIASLNVAYDVEDNQKDFIFVKTSHMLADYDLHLDLADADRDKIHEMMNEKKLNKTYDIYFSDPIYRLSNESVYKNDSESYLKMALKYSLKHPERFLFYTFKSSDKVWDITKDEDWRLPSYRVLSDEHMSDASRERFFKIKNTTPQKSYENVHSYNVGTEKFSLVNSIVYEAQENLILDTILNSPALYMYLAILLLIMMQLITKSKEGYLIYLPNLLNIILVFGSIPDQDTRYLYPNLLVFYLLIIILISLIQNSKDKSTTN